MASFSLLLPLTLPLLLALSLLGARSRFLSSRLTVLMMVFFPLLTSPPVSFLLLPSNAQSRPPGARVRLRRLLLHPYLVQHLRHSVGRIPFPFLLSPLPRSLLLLLISLLSSLLFLFLHPLSARSSRPCLVLTCWSTSRFPLLTSPSVSFLQIFSEKKCAAGKTYPTKCAAGQKF